MSESTCWNKAIIFSIMIIQLDNNDIILIIPSSTV